jgi:sugar phosphate isomerase/epimerase
MNESQLAINSVSTRGAALPETLAAYAAAGFHNVEFCLPLVKEFLDSGATINDVRALLARHQLHCIGGFEEAVQAFSEPKQRAENHSKTIENAKLIAALGGNVMVVGTDGPATSDSQTANSDVIGVLARIFRTLADEIRPLGVTLCIEFNWSPVVKSLRTAVDVARRSGADNVGVLFDPAHYHCTPTKFDQLNSANVPFIRHVHLDDMRDKPGELSHCNDDRVLPGQGILDLRGIIARLEEHGYGGYFSIEMFNAELWRMPPAQSARLMHDSLLPLLSATSRG